MKLFILMMTLALSQVSYAGFGNKDYKFIAASQTKSKLGPSGGKGDVIERIMIIPETTGAGTVTLYDGSGSASAYSTNVFVAGTLGDLSPIQVELGATSVSADWNITTGSNVHVIAIGQFK